MASERYQSIEAIVSRQILSAKRLLILPSAQRIEPPPSEDYRATFVGAAAENLAVSDLKAAYSRASNLVHERHPERLLRKQLEIELAAIEEDARRLRPWLWLHIMFLKGGGFLVQMSQFDTPSFMDSIGRLDDLHAECA